MRVESPKESDFCICTQQITAAAAAAATCLVLYSPPHRNNAFAGAKLLHLRSLTASLITEQFSFAIDENESERDDGLNGSTGEKRERE